MSISRRDWLFSVMFSLQLLVFWIDSDAFMCDEKTSLATLPAYVLLKFIESIFSEFSLGLLKVALFLVLHLLSSYTLFCFSAHAHLLSSMWTSDDGRILVRGKEHTPVSSFCQGLFDLNSLPSTLFEFRFGVSMPQVHRKQPIVLIFDDFRCLTRCVSRCVRRCVAVSRHSPNPSPIPDSCPVSNMWTFCR